MTHNPDNLADSPSEEPIRVTHVSLGLTTRAPKLLGGESMKLLKLILLCCFAAAFVLPATFTRRVEGQTEAPTGFDTTNGLVPQGTPVPEGAEPTRANFEGLKTIFEERDAVADGLGPVYNA